MAGTTCPQAGGLARQSSSPASLHCSIDFVIRTSILLRMVLGRAIATPRGLPFPFRQLHRSPVMSIALPFVAFLLAGAFAAYNRLRLAWWAAITATLLRTDEHTSELQSLMRNTIAVCCLKKK